MDSAKAALERFVLDPKNAELLALVKAARNGIVYGTKVRLPHALVMVFLFRSGTFREKLITVLKATRTHARNLGTFVFLYKAIMYILRHSPRPDIPTGKEASYDSLLAGLIGGYAVFGRGIPSSVNQQIVIYVFARVVLGLAKMTVQSEHLLSPATSNAVRNNAWTVFAAASWGGVMWLFRWHPELLQPSLRSSMVYLYDNADKWDGLKNFIVYNK